MDADNARLTEELRTVRSWSVAPTGNGKSHPAALLPSAQSAQSADETPALSWPGELADWVEGLEKNRHDWRKLAKSVRWQLIANVVQQIPADESASSAWFDTHRPAWMSTARAAALTFGQNSWTRVVHMALAGEVPA